MGYNRLIVSFYNKLGNQETDIEVWRRGAKQFNSLGWLSPCLEGREEEMERFFSAAQKTNLAAALFGIQQISVDEVLNKIERGEKFHFFDMRDDEKWEQGHAVGAYSLPRAYLEQHITSTISDRTAEIVLYCDIGLLSALVMDRLQRLGYANVYSMAGGYRAWKKANYPITVVDE
ncbi:MAG: rhodanese-like domain-containing protein [Acidobacteriota bacterium]